MTMIILFSQVIQVKGCNHNIIKTKKRLTSMSTGHRSLAEFVKKLQEVSHEFYLFNYISFKRHTISVRMSVTSTRQVV